MSMISLRPTFRLQLAGDLQVIQQRLREILQRPAWQHRGQIYGEYAEFHVPENEQRYWSPHLAVHLEPLDHEQRIQYRHTDGAHLASVAGEVDQPATSFDPRVSSGGGTTLLVGRFAPRQNVWMLVWIVYLAMGFIVFFALLYAGVQYWMNSTPWAMGVGMGAAACILALHFVSMIGQGWSGDQMQQLRTTLDDLLKESGLEPIDLNAGHG